MSDASDRATARAELLRHAQPDIDPVLTSSGPGNEIDALLDKHRRGSTWAPGTFYAAGAIVLPTVRGRHRYRCEVSGVSDDTVLTSVQRVSVSEGGSDYTSPPTISFTGGGGFGAAGVAIIEAGAVVGVFIQTGGSGYTSAPAVVFSGGGGSGAVATSSVNGREPVWPERDGGRVSDGMGTAGGSMLRWVEDGPSFDNIYDVRGAAEEAWWLKARKASDRIRFKLDDYSADDQLTYERCVETARSFAPVNF